MPRFFDYPDMIIEELSCMGYDVDFWDDRPSTNSFIKAIIRLNRKLATPFIRRYFNRIYKTLKVKQYDFVFLISGQSLSFSEKMFANIKKSQSHAKFILYQWDSIKNFPYITQMHKFFDKCYSFDKRDVEKYENLNFLPLFYTARYEKVGKRGCEKIKYDFCFIGTAHPKKYKYIKNMSQQLQYAFPNQYIYFFFPSRLVYWYRKIKNPEMREAKINEFHFIPLSGDEMDEVYRQSSCVLDSAQSGQIGLTIRIFEALAAKKKIITTNEDIRNYDFYREENIYVYDGTFDFTSRFFTQDYQEIDESVYQKYSLKNWLSFMLID